VSGIADYRIAVVRPMRRIIVVMLAIGFLVALLSSSANECWDGSFAQAEYQLIFTDADGRPLQGIELRVEDSAGNDHRHFPVTDYVARNIPTSDEDGKLVFHHTCYGGLEFGGRCSHLLWFISVGDCESPRYVCRFMRDGREIYRCWFNDLNLTARSSESIVKANWDWTENTPWTLDRKIDGEEWNARRSACDRDRDGKLNIEERAEWQASAESAEVIESIQCGSKEASEELEFSVVRSTIVIK
jgi:hypothetical protein